MALKPFKEAWETYLVLALAHLLSLLCSLLNSFEIVEYLFPKAVTDAKRVFYAFFFILCWSSWHCIGYLFAKVFEYGSRCGSEKRELR